MDEKQFVEVFNLLRDRTKNWTEITPELLKENPQFLLIIRCALGFAAKELGNRIGKSDSNIWWFESKNGKFTSFNATKEWVHNINILLKKKSINLKDALEKWNNFKAVRSEISKNVRKIQPSVSKLNEDKLLEWFNELSSKTNSFTKIDSDILFENAQNTMIFRLLLGLDLRKFSKVLNRATWTVRKWENGIIRMRKLTSVEVTKRIINLLKKSKLPKNFNTVLQTFRISQKIFFNFKLEKLINNGLRLAKKSKITDSERIIINNLSNSNIRFEVHANVSGIKKKVNADFAIPNGKNPKIVIETFSINNKNSGRFNLRTRHSIIDHKFQSIKMRQSNVKTILFILFKGRPILDDFLHKSIELDLLNTDFLLLNEEISTLQNLIKKILISN